MLSPCDCLIPLMSFLMDAGKNLSKNFLFISSHPAMGFVYEKNQVLAASQKENGNAFILTSSSGMLISFIIEHKMIKSMR